ncbi:MAG: hypothetical protein ACXAAH_12635 [Promethearchaeota archaeon]|jgi:hypothetical protein
MSLFKKSNKTESNERKLSKLDTILRLNPRYLEEKEMHKIRREIKGYL